MDTKEIAIQTAQSICADLGIHFASDKATNIIRHTEKALEKNNIDIKKTVNSLV